MIGIIIALIILLLVGNGYLGYKYLMFKKLTKEYDDIGTGRFGFYEYFSGGAYRAIVYVKEMDKYTDEYSMLKVARIEPETATSWAKRAFVSLRKTSDIEWLESIDQIKRLRKEKLLKIKKL